MIGLLSDQNQCLKEQFKGWVSKLILLNRVVYLTCGLTVLYTLVDANVITMNIFVGIYTIYFKIISITNCRGFVSTSN